MSTRLLASICLAALLTIAGTASGAPGDLDPTFVGDSSVILDVTDGRGEDVAVDSQGRILIAGNVDPPGGGDNNDFAVARFMPDGSPDLSFSGDGFTSIDASDIGDGDDGNAVAIDSQGRILIAGYASDGSDLVLAIVRMLPTGEPDLAFGGGDAVQTDDIDTDDPDRIDDIVIDSADRPVAVGSTVGSDRDFIVARYTSAGILDSSFGLGDGYEILNVGSAVTEDYADAVALDSLGRVVVAGETSPTGGSGDETDFAVARFTPEGVLDPSFSGGDSTNGRTIVDMSGASLYDYANGLSVMAGDKPLAVGTAAVPGLGDEVAVLRLDSTGSPDPTFSGDGKDLAGLGTEFENANDVAIDASGAIVVAGTTYPPSVGDGRFLVGRFLPGGGLDPSFAGGGITASDLAPGDDVGEAVAIDPATGRILVAGYHGPFGSADYAVARYEGVPRCGGLVPTMAGTSGKDTLNGTAAADVISGLGGNDTLKGKGGKDRLCGGDGKDTLNGGAGNDQLFGEGGKDKLLGKAGKDKLKGGPGKDTQTQ